VKLSKAENGLSRKSIIAERRASVTRIERSKAALGSPRRCCFPITDFGDKPPIGAPFERDNALSRSSLPASASGGPRLNSAGAATDELSLPHELEERAPVDPLARLGIEP
jgi:hypothetical protein